MSDSGRQTSDQPSSAAEPFRFSLLTLLGVMTAVAICCAVAVWSADPIVLPILAGAILFRALFSPGPHRLARFAMSASIGGLVTLAACLAGWDNAASDPGIGVPSDTTFLDFVLYVAPLNPLRCYAASGTLAYFLSFQMLRPSAQPRQRIFQVIAGLLVVFVATVFMAFVMGLIHYPVGEHH